MKNYLVKLLLFLTYPLMVLTKLLCALTGRDPMRLKEPQGTCWIPRHSQPDSPSYFSESSVVEGKDHGGFTFLAAVPLRVAARCIAPPRPVPGEKSPLTAEREEGIPDEVYTLW